ncbi:host cell division inhibitory peptide Kil [Enterobacter bugandensis]|nr:host cell division inhibitory peptide Kil [Enterobacter bugandensis]
MDLSQLTPIQAAQSKFAIAAFIGDKEMFEQALIQFAIATGTKVNHDNSVRISFDRLSEFGRGTGTGH